MATPKKAARRRVPTRTKSGSGGRRPPRAKATFKTSPEFESAASAALAVFQRELVASEDVVRGTTNANLSTVNGRGMSSLYKSADGSVQFTIKVMEVHRQPKAKTKKR